MVYYYKRYWLNSTKRKGFYEANSRRNKIQIFRCPHQWSCMDTVNCWATICDSMCQILPTRKVCRASESRVCSGGSARHAVLACMTDFSYSSPHRAKTNVYHKSFCEHNLSDQTGTSWITASDTQKHCFQVSIPRTQSSSPKSWPRVSPEDSLLLGVCKIQAALSCWVNPSVHGRLLIVIWNLFLFLIL